MIIINLFGPFSVSAKGRKITFHSRRSAMLLAYLALSCGAPLKRERVAADFWSDREERVARKSLNNELWRLRQALAVHGVSDTIVQADDTLTVAPGSDLKIDLFDYEALLSAGPKAPSGVFAESELDNLRKATALYRGELLAGVHEDWALIPRQTMTLRQTAALEALMTDAVSAGRHDETLSVAGELLKMDPLSEAAHRAIMRSLSAQGNRAGAFRQFESCARMLADELGVEPMEETQALRDELFVTEGYLPSATHYVVDGSSPPAERVLDEITAALRALSRARLQLRRMIGRPPMRRSTSNDGF